VGRQGHDPGDLRAHPRDPAILFGSLVLLVAVATLAELAADRRGTVRR
jgi:hypothetical protein